MGEALVKIEEILNTAEASLEQAIKGSKTIATQVVSIKKMTDEATITKAPASAGGAEELLEDISATIEEEELSIVVIPLAGEV